MSGPRFVLPLLRGLHRAGAHALSRRLYRAYLGKGLRHMAPCGPRFHLEGASEDLSRAIHFDGQVLGQTHSVASIRGTRKGCAFILGTGPSVKGLDLSPLRSHALFGVNGAIALMPSHGLRPRHYTVTDPDFFEHRLDLIREIMGTGCDCFFSAAGLSAIAENDSSLLKHPRLFLTEIVNRAYGQARRPPEEFRRWAKAETDLVLPSPTRDDDSRVGWSWNMAKGIFCSRTILFRALQIAAHLGYRRLFVLGMDLGFQGKGPRAYEEGGKARPSKLDRDFEPFILPAFQVLGGLIRSGEIEVYNLSSQSRMPESVIPRLSLEEALRMAC